jgi:hypothetical protein
VKNILSILSGILFVVAFIPYIIFILRSKNSSEEGKPIKATWLIWASLDTITLIGMIIGHSVNGQIIGAVSGAWIVFFLSLKYGKPGWTKIDKWCLGGAMIGIILLITIKNPAIGMSVSLTSVFLGSVPTFKSAWEKPERENKLAWFIYFLSSAIAVLAIPKWDIQNALQPFCFMVIETVMMFILFIKPQFRKI